MTPSILKQITSVYTECIQQVILLNQASVALKNETKEITEEDKEEEVDAAFQYEALIEQLRFEKQDATDNYKSARKLLNLIYLNNKDKLDVNSADSLENMKVSEIAAVFKIDWAKANKKAKLTKG